MPDDVLTFEELRQVQNQERDSDTLQALDESFFDRAQNYLELKQGGDDHLENQEYRNARNIVEDILDMRQKKIVKLAFLAVKSGVTVDNLLPHEESLFEDVKDRISTYRDRRHTAVFDGSGTADASGGDGTGDPARESASPAAEDAAGADEAAGDKVELEEDSGQEDEAVDRGNSEIGEEEQAPGDDIAGDVTDADDRREDDVEDDGTEEESAADSILQFGDGEDGTVADGGGADEQPGGGEEGDETRDEGGRTGQGDPEPDSDAGRGDDSRVTVEVREHVPEFMGTDLEAYGPFEEGEEVEVPAENADVLVQQGKAERA